MTTTPTAKDHWTPDMDMALHMSLKAEHDGRTVDAQFWCCVLERLSGNDTSPWPQRYA